MKTKVKASNVTVLMLPKNVSEIVSEYLQGLGFKHTGDDGDGSDANSHWEHINWELTEIAKLNMLHEIGRQIVYVGVDYPS